MLEPSHENFIPPEHVPETDRRVRTNSSCIPNRDFLRYWCSPFCKTNESPESVAPTPTPHREAITQQPKAMDPMASRPASKDILADPTGGNTNQDIQGSSKNNSENRQNQTKKDNISESRTDSASSTKLMSGDDKTPTNKAPDSSMQTSSKDDAAASAHLDLEDKELLSQINLIKQHVNTLTKNADLLEKNIGGLSQMESDGNIRSEVTASQYYGQFQDSYDEFKTASGNIENLEKNQKKC